MTARPGKALGTAALIVALVALTLAIFAVFYQKQVAPLKAGMDDESALYTSMTGLSNAKASNVLDKRYTDADGDLIADPPADAGKQLDPPTLTFSYVVSDNQDEFKAAFGGLMEAIGKATGKPVTFVPYTEVVPKLQDLRDGKLAICGVATGAVPLAVCTSGFVPVAQAADASGAAGYKMEIISPADSKLTGIADLKGHELTLTDPSSNSGYKAPLVLMRENGMLPPKDFLIRYSQGHTQSIQGVKNKQFEAAAVAGDVLAREEAAGHIGKGDYKVIYTSVNDFPDAALGISCDLKPELAAKIKAAILGYDWKGTGLEKLFAAEGKTKFVAADYKKNWEYVRRTDEAIGYAYTLPPKATPSTQPMAPTTQQTAASTPAARPAAITAAPIAAVSTFDRESMLKQEVTLWEKWLEISSSRPDASPASAKRLREVRDRVATLKRELKADSDFRLTPQTPASVTMPIPTTW